MRLPAFTHIAVMTGLAAMASAAPVLASEPAPAAGMPAYAPPPPPPQANGLAAPTSAAWEQQRQAWLTACRRRIGDNGTGGAIIGGVVGAVAGHEIAGRHDRVLGTVAGAAVGAVAGAAIDRAEDRTAVQDYCSATLQAYFVPGFGPSMLSGPYGYAGNYGGPMMMVPVTMAPAPKPECKETETVEYVTTYEPVRRRAIPAKAKRVRVAADKRVLIK